MRGRDCEPASACSRGTSLALEPGEPRTALTPAGDPCSRRSLRRSVCPPHPPPGIPLRAYTSDGSVEVEDSQGSIDVCTSAGWIGLTRVAGPVLARSSSGSIYAGFTARPSGTLATSSGTIEVAVPADATFELRAQAQGGSIDVDPALCRHASGGARSVRAIVNGGGDCLWLRTTGGDIYVRAEPPTAADRACRA